MKRSIVVVVACFLAFGAVAVHSQVTESATGRRLRIYAGGEASAFQPDYAGNGIAQAGPNRLYGIGTYVDANFSRWLQFEGEARWLKWNQYAGVSQNSYLFGPRIPIIEHQRFTPYGKFLFGMGSGSFISGSSTTFAYGGGLDYRLSRRLVARADFEYQHWSVSNITLVPYGLSVGMSYRVF